MEENFNNEREVTTKDILKHYCSSILIYGVLLSILSLSPLFYETIQESWMDYISFFIIYYLAYIIIAPVVFFIFKPKSILESRNLAIVEYIKRQFRKNETTEEFLKNIEPTEPEKQALMILFIKSFFGFNCLSAIFNKYFVSPGYDIDFIKTFFVQYLQDSSNGGNLLTGFVQFIIDTGDMWLKFIVGLSMLVYAVSYLTETEFFKNKIKSADTTPLGVLSCIACYYPITILTNKFIEVTPDSLLPVNNQIILAILNLLIILVNFVSLIAVLRLGTKVGNLTNRGIVTGFPYNIIRHPDYTMQICYIILTTIPLFLMSQYSIITKIIITIATLAWVYIYYLRAITEERHLIKDPEYQKYVEKVKYRFIPKLF